MYSVVITNWHRERALKYSLWSFISETMLKYAGVPAKAKIKLERAAAASANLGDLKSSKSASQGPNWGAAEGRSWMPTEMVRVMTGVC